MNTVLTSLGERLGIARMIPGKKCLLLLLLGIWSLAAQQTSAQPAANDHTVLILGNTVSGGTSSREAIAAIAAGFSVEVVTDAQWGAKSASDFASYRAIVLGDPTCVVGTGPITAALANKATWGPVISGHVIIIGTDPVYHAPGQPGAATLITNGISFVLADDAAKTKTGAYIDMSCYYAGTTVSTPVPLLDVFSPGGFTMQDPGGCFNVVHITATHPALTGLTDANLSNWSCSVHEAFLTWDQVNFQVLAMAVSGSAYTAPDGTVGTPYVIARGATVISDITLSPEVDSSFVGVTRTFTAAVTQGGSPASGKLVTFSVFSGPNTGATGSGTTGASGTTTFSYTSSVVGTDAIRATFVDVLGHTQTSNVSTEKWKASIIDNTPPACNLTAILPGPPKQMLITVNDTQSGLQSIAVVTHTNCNVSVASFTAGTTSPVVVTATKINQSLSATVTLRVTDVAGNSSLCDPVYTTLSAAIPQEFELGANYPNPFNPTTTIDLGLAQSFPGGVVTLKIYDMLGREVKTLVDEPMQPGHYSVQWDGTNNNNQTVPSGIYMYRVVAGKFVATRKMTLLK